MTAELPALWSEVCTFYYAAHALNTRVQYDAHLRYFAYFCVATGYDFERPSQYEVMMYSALLARTLAPQSVNQYLKGLKDHYKQRGYSDFADGKQ